MKIQKTVRRHEARKTFNKLRVSVLLLQTGLRAMAAHREFRFRKQTKAATIIQVILFLPLYILKANFSVYWILNDKCSLKKLYAVPVALS